jgi:hypothetical protein
MTVLLHAVGESADAARPGELDDGVGVVDVVAWLRRAQNVPRELNPYTARHRIVGPAL